MCSRPFLLAVGVSCITGMAWLATVQRGLSENGDSCSAVVFSGQRLEPQEPWLASNTVALPAGQGMLAIGDPAAWKLFTFTNSGSCGHVAVLTFSPERILDPGTNGSNPDLDLYVSTNATLAVLDPEALATAWTSLGPGLQELVTITNEEPAVFFIAIKNESQVTAEFSLWIVSSERPFAEDDGQGNFMLRGFPASASIPDAGATGTPMLNIAAIAPESFLLHRVIVSNVVTHPRHGDLHTALSFGNREATLQVPGGNEQSGTQLQLFDDSQERDLPEAKPSSGPGSLNDFAGLPSRGQWLLTQADTVSGGSGTNDALHLVLQKQQDLREGAFTVLLPGATVQHALFVPEDATNVSIHLSSGIGVGNVTVGLRRQDESAPQQVRVDFEDVGAEPVLWRTKYSIPQLNPGLHYVTVLNNGSEPLPLDVSAAVFVRPEPEPPFTLASTSPVEIVDDGVTVSRILMPQPGRISSVAAGLRIQHPRISDLTVKLVSPAGTPVMLMENRGGSSTEGLGLDQVIANTVPVSSSGGAAASTNVMNVGTGPGTVLIQYHNYSLPDAMRIYRGSERIFDSGLVPDSGEWRLTYGADPGGRLTIVMNEGDNYDPNTAWDYVVTTTTVGPVHAVFLEETNLAPHRIKFVAAPFTNAPVESLLKTNAPLYRPEDPLGVLTGENVQGTWTLEVIDSKPGPEVDALPPVLRSWQIHFVLETPSPLPIPLAHGVAHQEEIPPGAARPYQVTVPGWATLATNRLLGASSPLQLWFDASSPPVPTNAGSQLLFFGASGQVVLSTNSNPSVTPGASYYLSLVNTGSTAVTATFQADFNITRLLRNSTQPVTLPPGPVPVYFGVEVNPHLASGLFELTNLTGNLELVLSLAPALPTLQTSEYRSASPGREPEEILVTPDSLPVPLQPGLWYVGIFNAGESAASATLSYKETAMPPLVSAEARGGTVRLTWPGPPWASYQVQWIPRLDSPNWMTFPQVAASSDGWFTFEDASPVSKEARFYRVVQVPEGQQ